MDSSRTGVRKGVMMAEEIRNLHLSVISASSDIAAEKPWVSRTPSERSIPGLSTNRK